MRSKWLQESMRILFTFSLIIILHSVQFLIVIVCFKSVLSTSKFVCLFWFSICQLLSSNWNIDLFSTILFSSSSFFAIVFIDWLTLFGSNMDDFFKLSHTNPLAWKRLTYSSNSHSIVSHKLIQVTWLGPLCYNAKLIKLIIF